MNCRNCGGAMELFATRGYFFCRYCGSFHFPENAPDQGVRVVAEGPHACPICKVRLASAVLDEAHAVQYCGMCRGVLMDRNTFADVVQHRRAWATDPPAPPVPLRQEELTRQINCPKCGARLETHPYYGPGNVVMDGCATCDVVWLDFGELKQIVDAPGRDRGTREVRPREIDNLPGPTAFRPIAGWESESAGRRLNLLDLLEDLLG
jgi:Zn-finger nucleic acid-binding protein